MASCRRHLPFYEHISLTVGFEKSAEQNRPEPPDGLGPSFREQSSKDPAANCIPEIQPIKNEALAQE